ncbi:inositol monophosphatase family protein [Microvirga sp. ACRRW]|uniref:inositol monophosphatase family protein n=1 Tax=Microvirga sp. ACRRW TaxID=2918205 RepID=UPI001EF747F7|nr:inositol monophosphatase family protein [Microvirga sp. ACRRW]MCG7391545.1 inositol monophosphatase family protein [Microvirga sp. ACRRW]
MIFSRANAVTVAEILRNAAQAEILPRFRNLSEGAIRTKSSQLDLVTDADEAAERVIEADLLRAFPNAVVIGEEGVSRSPQLLDGLADADLAFILDPVDGTLNFASGLPLFGVMAAAVVKGEVVCGVILDPILDDWAVAVRGEGAWMQRQDGTTQALQVASPVPLAEMVGNVSWRYLPETLMQAVTANFPRIAMVTNLRCAAHAYRQIASGHMHFAFSSSVMPWDHAAGWLIHHEAGGYSAHFDGSPYRPINRGGGLINAPDRESWQALRDALLPSQL